MDWAEPVRNSITEKVTLAGGFIADKGPQFLQATYRAFSIPLRIPTWIRRMANNQTYVQRDGNINDLDFWPTTLGLVTAGILHWQVSYPIINEEAKQGNYIPALVALGFNFASGCYELGRLSKSREEYATHKAERLGLSSKTEVKVGDGMGGGTG